MAETEMEVFLQLWFILNLIIYTAIYILYRLISDRRVSNKNLQVYPQRFPPNAGFIRSIIVRALLTFIVRLKFNPLQPGNSDAAFRPGNQVYYILRP